jgi:hypothetical protein
MWSRHARVLAVGVLAEQWLADPFDGGHAAVALNISGSLGIGSQPP